MSDDDTQLSDSGGTMQRLSGAAEIRPVDLDRLEELRVAESDGPWTAAGSSPYYAPGDVVQWRYGRACDPMRVVRDDERGLVAWLADATELVQLTPVDGRGMRDRPAEARFLVDRQPTIRAWQSGGILRIAPTGKPWSVWVFWEDDGSLAGHYVNLELPHRRSGDETNSRDLILDLWLEPSGELWLKDADELEGAAASGLLTPGLDDEIRAIADWARADLVDARDWPLDDEWTQWRPPADWETPRLPETGVVADARRNTLQP